jgi:hypothetical protein
MSGHAGRTILAAAVVLTAASALSATTFQTKTFTCPLDGTKFEGKVVAATDSDGGVDSDLCPWPAGEVSLPHEVQVCPKDFYAVLNAYFDLDLTEDIKANLTAALAKWREKHAESKTVDDISPPLRWELTAVCAIVKHDDTRQMAEIWLRASWVQRQTGLKGFTLEFGDPISAFEVLTDVERDIRKAKKAKDRTELTFQMVMGAQRAGDVPRRDKYIAELEKQDLDEAGKARLEALRKSFAAEAEYQKLALARYVKAVDAEEGTPKDRALYQYLVGDLNRRLGNRDEAVKAFRKLLTTGEVDRNVKDVAGFLMDSLTAE